MKRIKLTADRFGPGYYQEAGLVIELADADADVELSRGRAVVAEKATNSPPEKMTTTPPEKATKTPPEKATRKPPEKRG